MGFDEFIGNSSIVQTLQKQLAEDRLPHTLLFAGIRGIGKQTLAAFLSMAANCAERFPDFCRRCPSCRKILADTHADVKRFGPDGQFIKIDAMRELSREVFFRPFEGRLRVFIVDEADRMNPEAANSVLKTLEEPPPSSLLILVSDRPSELLTTIRSRCQIYPFAPISPNEIAVLLERRGGHSSAERLLLSRISAGSVGLALSLQLDLYQKTRHEMLELLQLCSKDFLYSKVVKTLASLSRQKDDFQDKMGVLYGLLHDLFLLKIDPTSELITNLDIRERLLNLSTVFSVERIVAGTQTLDHLEAGARRNLNKHLALDQFVFRLSGQLPLEHSY
jgi:DNA polymerase-3 subunit delta'